MPTSTRCTNFARRNWPKRNWPKLKVIQSRSADTSAVELRLRSVVSYRRPAPSPDSRSSLWKRKPPKRSRMLLQPPSRIPSRPHKPSIGPSLDARGLLGLLLKLASQKTSLTFITPMIPISDSRTRAPKAYCLEMSNQRSGPKGKVQGVKSNRARSPARSPKTPKLRVVGCRLML